MGHKHSKTARNARCTTPTRPADIKLQGTCSGLGFDEQDLARQASGTQETTQNASGSTGSTTKVDDSSSSLGGVGLKSDRTLGMSSSPASEGSEMKDNGSKQDIARSGPRLRRSSSALPPPKSAISGIKLLHRSKSMPVDGHRRADINLDDGAIAAVSLLQESLKQAMDVLPSSRLLTEKDIGAFLSSCEVHAFGRQSLTSTPGEERGVYGSLPSFAHVLCVKGLKGPMDKSPNQDNFSYCKYNGYDIFTLQDGHGPGGHFVSYRGVRSLPLFLTRSQHFPERMEEALTEAHDACHKDILKHFIDTNFDIQVSGAASIMMIRKGSKLWLAHTGDSRIVVGSTSSSNVVAETVDHKPTDPAERTRLELNGSEIQTFSFENNVEISRVFVKGTDYPGLCMSRSIGDQSVKDHGVTPVPDVAEVTIVPNETFVVLASDGVWEFVPSRLVCSSLSKKLKAEGKVKCVARIVTESKKRWKANEGSYCDDITALLVEL